MSKKNVDLWKETFGELEELYILNCVFKEHFSENVAFLEDRILKIWVNTIPDKENSLNGNMFREFRE